MSNWTEEDHFRTMRKILKKIPKKTVLMFGVSPWKIIKSGLPEYRHQTEEQLLFPPHLDQISFNSDLIDLTQEDIASHSSLPKDDDIQSIHSHNSIEEVQFIPAPQYHVVVPQPLMIGGEDFSFLFSYYNEVMEARLNKTTNSKILSQLPYAPIPWIQNVKQPSTSVATTSSNYQYGGVIRYAPPRGNNWRYTPGQYSLERK